MAPPVISARHQSYGFRDDPDHKSKKYDCQRHEHPAAAAEHTQRHAVVQQIAQLQPAGNEHIDNVGELRGGQRLRPLVHGHDRRGKQRENYLKQGQALLFFSGTILA